VGNFCDGLAGIFNGNKKGFIDKSGVFVIAPQFDYQNDFSEGLASVGIKNKYFFIDKDGKIITEVPSPCGPFQEGFAWIRLSEKCFGFVNHAGNIVIEPRYINVPCFSEGLAQVVWREKETKSGYIDTNGKIVIDGKYDYESNFHNGLAAVSRKDKDGYIDRKGKLVWKLTL
jgi:hypothetical protein